MSVGFICGKQKFRRTVVIQPMLPASRMVQLDAACHSMHLRTSRVALPRPRIAEPDRRKQPQTRCFRTTVGSGDLNEDVFDITFRVLDQNIEIPVFGEHSGVQQFVFRIVPAAAAVFFDQLRVRECGLRILVQILHVRVSRSTVQIEVRFLHILAVIAFFTAQSEEPVFQKWVAAVPQRQRETDPLMTVADARNAVSSSGRPVTGRDHTESSPRHCHRGCSPRHRAPCPFAAEKGPAVPMSGTGAGFGELDFLVRHRGVLRGLRACSVRPKPQPYMPRPVSDS